MFRPKVSIITPSFNRADIVHETSNSIFAQTYDNWEWIIVDDGSTDNSWEVLKSFAIKDERVKVFKRDREPKGACTCRNIAVEKSAGNYVMFLDTDDLLAPFCLEQRVLAVTECPDDDFVIFPMLQFHKEPYDIGVLWNIDNGEDDLLRVLKGDPVCQGTGTLWKKTSFIDVGMWREDLKLWQDIELHIRSFLYPVKYSKRLDLEPDVFLRVSVDSLSRVGYHSAPKLKSRLSVYKYAADEVIRKELVDKYAQGLRIMGADIILSLINGRLFDDAKTVIEFVNHHQFYTDKEINIFRKYMNAYRWKMYKIPALFNSIKKSASDVAPYGKATLNTVKWRSPKLFKNIN